MKELSIKEKAKAYDEALKVLHKYDGANIMFSQSLKEEMFPELKESESEDEKIRAAIIHFISHTPAVPKGIIDKKQMIAWLEKQGESDETKAKMFLINKGYPIDANGKFPTYEEMYNIIKDGLENQGKQKPYGLRQECSDCQFNYAGECKGYCATKRGDQKPADKVEPTDYNSIDPHFGKPIDKVEPKFHEGEWIITNKNHIWYVDEIPETTSYLYRLINQYGKVEVAEFEVVDNVARLWTIEDAKDGDVLSWDDSKCITIFKNIYDKDSFNSYGFVGGCTGTFESRMSYHDIEGAHPATKEQRDILMKAIANAGYTFDFEKKELKEVEWEPQTGDTFRKN